jgi:hypothetical protein
VPETLQVESKGVGVLADRHTCSAGAEARLDDGREADDRQRAAAHERRSWVRHACAGEPERCCELVARGEDPRRGIQDEDSTGDCPAQLVQPPLDPGEARPYAQAPEHDVADACAPAEFRGLENCGLEPQLARRVDNRRAGRLGGFADDQERHAGVSSRGGYTCCDPCVGSAVRPLEKRSLCGLYLGAGPTTGLTPPSANSGDSHVTVPRVVDNRGASSDRLRRLPAPPRYRRTPSAASR